MVCAAVEYPDPLNCSSIPPNCTLVKPTKEMKKIANKLKNASKSIEQRLAWDVKRAGTFSSCRELLSKKSYASTKAKLAAARREADKRILKSVLVCGTECLTVSFAEEVKKVKSGFSGSRSQNVYAKSVVTCSGVVRQGSDGKGQRTDTILTKSTRTRLFRSVRSTRLKPW